MLTLYGTKGSGSAAVEGAARRRAAVSARGCGELGAHARLEKLKRVNPLVQVPSLVLEDGAVMTESAAILIWLACAIRKAVCCHAIRRKRSAPRDISRQLLRRIGIIDYPPRFCVRSATRQRRAHPRRDAVALYEYWGIFADEFGAR